MRKKIIRRDLLDDVTYLAELHPLLRRVYAARHVQSANDLDRRLESLLPYQALLGIDKAVHLLATTLQQQGKFLIVGDFDADGATSTALAVRALRSFGAQHVSFLVPNRFAFGYGH
jgi:single-stranded-DNA-specific exonuclease